MRTDPALAEALETCQSTWEPGASPADAGFDALLERWPDDPVALEAVGDAYDGAGDTERAIACYRGALAGLDGTRLRRFEDMLVGRAMLPVDAPFTPHRPAWEMLEQLLGD